MRPLPMVMGAASELPTPIGKVLSAVVVTALSDDGLGPGPEADAAAAAAPGDPLLALPAVTGAVAEGVGAVATTDSSVVGNNGAALAAGVGETTALAFAGSGFGSTVSLAIASC